MTKSKSTSTSQVSDRSEIAAGKISTGILYPDWFGAKLKLCFDSSNAPVLVHAILKEEEEIEKAEKEYQKTFKKTDYPIIVMFRRKKSKSNTEIEEGRKYVGLKYPAEVIPENLLKKIKIKEATKKTFSANIIVPAEKVPTILQKCSEKYNYEPMVSFTTNDYWEV
jgi:hypothetical protein